MLSGFEYNAIGNMNLFYYSVADFRLTQCGDYAQSDISNELESQHVKLPVLSPFKLVNFGVRPP